VHGRAEARLTLAFFFSLFFGQNLGAQREVWSIVELFELVLANGKIIDGTGNPWFKADIAIGRDKIVAIGHIPRTHARIFVDVRDLIVSPGFIDIHTHSDFAILVNPTAESAVSQGVTTQVIGNCGYSAAPLNYRNRDLLAEQMKSWGIFPPGLRLNWNHMDDYLKRIERSKVAVNIAALLGHSTVRSYVMGFENREPMRRELEEMKKVVRQEMQQGLFGFSSGLIYNPGCFAKEREVVTLCKVVAKLGGIYTTHIRDEGDRGIGWVVSVKEGLDTARSASIPLHISHLEAIGRLAWGSNDRVFRLIEQARAGGQDVTFDQFIYESGPASLFAWLPDWAKGMSEASLRKSMSHSAIRRRLIAELGKKIEIRGGPDKVMVAACQDKSLLGKTLSQISRIRRMNPAEAAITLLSENRGEVAVLTEALRTCDIRQKLKHPNGMIITDGMALRAENTWGTPAPSSFGTFARLLGKYVRQDKVLTLEDAIRRITSLPAARLGLTNRGVLKEGMYADITVFDPRKLADKASYANPVRYAQGIRYVLVNGRFVFDGGQCSGELPGRVLRKSWLFDDRKLSVMSISNKFPNAG
jgi:N-acyl-D-amino-acid deacylase